MLRQIDTDLWVTERPQKILLAQVKTRMTVIKLADGTLFVHSPARLDEVTRASLDELGPECARIAEPSPPTAMAVGRLSR